MNPSLLLLYIRIIHSFSLDITGRSLNLVKQSVDNNPSSSTHWILQADINQDGYSDIISISFNVGGTYWYKNPNAKRSIPLKSNEWVDKEFIHNLPGSIHADIFDMNNDGFPDLIVAYHFGNCFMKCTEKDGSVIIKYFKSS